MVRLLKDNEVDMNEAPCRCGPFIKTGVQMQERLPLKKWRIDSGRGPKTTQKRREGNEGGKKDSRAARERRQSANLEQRQPNKDIQRLVISCYLYNIASVM